MSQGQETINIKAGEKIELFSRSFSSIPMRYQFTAEAVGSTALSGLVEVVSQQSLLKKPVKKLQLKKSNLIKASMWDTFLTIYLVADCDMAVSIPTKQMGSKWRLISLVLLLVVVASVIIAAVLN